MAAPRTPRLVTARRHVLLGGLTALTLAATPPALWASEGGEAGEGAALADLPEAVGFLTLLGLFEAQHRIVAGLYALGDVAMAQEHLAGSHHAFYDDVRDGIAATGTPSFEAGAQSFADAVNTGAAPDQVQAAADAVLAALTGVRTQSADKDQMLAAEALLRVAASDLQAGMQDGTIALAQEYRDAWGFATVAQGWLGDLAGDADANVAAAATSALSGNADVDAQFAGLNATSAPGDAGALLAAAARVELAAYRLK